MRGYIVGEEYMDEERCDGEQLDEGEKRSGAATMAVWVVATNSVRVLGVRTFLVVTASHLHTDKSASRSLGAL